MEAFGTSMNRVYCTIELMQVLMQGALFLVGFTMTWHSTY
jgi:hypothetical protein